MEWHGVTSKDTTSMDNGSNGETWNYLHWAVGHHSPAPLGLFGPVMAQ